MRKEEMADFLEEESEHLEVRYMQWLLSGVTTDEAHLRHVAEFVNWCKAQNKADITAPRKGGSYQEVRRDLRDRAVEHVAALLRGARC